MVANTCGIRAVRSELNLTYGARSRNLSVSQKLCRFARLR